VSPAPPQAGSVASAAPSGRRGLARFAALSIATSLVVLTLKVVAWRLTGAVGLLADALESIVNVVAALATFYALRVAGRPADEDHEFGHGKAEYFASGFEGALIGVAALAIVASAIPRLIHPEPPEASPVGLGVSVAASALNFAVARVLLAAGKRHRSPSLEADGTHLMTDVWTSVGVLAGLGVVFASGVARLDPIIAIVLAIHILGEGAKIVRRAGMGLLDGAMPREGREALVKILDSYEAEGVRWHALKTRDAGVHTFVSVHVLVPGAWPLSRAHDVAQRIEDAMRASHVRLHVITHLEPLEDPRAHDDAWP
jgi:cation diffusion facilitator family transporter